MRATPPSLRMSAGTRSKAMTAQAPASSEILACSALVTSMITPPLSISARPTFNFQLGSFSNTNILIHLLLRGDIFQSPHLLKGLLLQRIYHWFHFDNLPEPGCLLFRLNNEQKYLQ